MLSVMIFFSEMVSIARAFKRRQIPCLFIKGILLHWQIHKTFPKAPPLDIDILVPKDCATLVFQIFSSLSYRIFLDPGTKNFTLTEAVQRSQVYAVKFVGQTPVTVDIHLLILIPTYLLPQVLSPALSRRISQDMIDRRKNVLIKGNLFEILDNEDTIIHLCLNFFFHHCCREKREFQMIAKAIDRLSPRWQVVSSRLRRYRLEKFAHYSLKTKKIAPPIKNPRARVLFNFVQTLVAADLPLKKLIPWILNPIFWKRLFSR